MTRRRVTWVVIGLGVIALALFVIGRLAVSGSGPAVRPKAESPAVAAAPAQGPSTPRTDVESARQDAGARSTRRMTPAAREALREALARRRAERGGAGVGSPGRGELRADGHDDEALSLKDKAGDSEPWERRQVAVLNELLGQCFAIGRAEDPALAGNLGVGFRLTGEPELGGLLENVQIDAAYTTITQATMLECVRESLYALELEPPPVGVIVERWITLRLGDREPR